MVVCPRAARQRHQSEGAGLARGASRHVHGARGRRGGRAAVHGGAPRRARPSLHAG